MKFFIASVFALSLAPAYSAGYIKDFDYQLTDISSLGLNKETLFDRMERSMLNLEKSICANRAHLWGWDLSRGGQVNTGKIFIFFGKSIWDKDSHGYMYHVAPYILENGSEFVMEATYNDIKKPLTVHEWIENETYNRVKGSDCVEISAEDTDLTAYFYDRKTLPEKRGAGKISAPCYIRKVPGHYWFPASIAFHDLKKNALGMKVDYNPKAFDKDDVYQACIEAVAPKMGRFLGNGQAKCKAYLKMK